MRTRVSCIASFLQKRGSINHMFETNCRVCGKKGWAYAVNKRGDLPAYYCSDVCKSAARYGVSEKPVDKPFEKKRDGKGRYV